MKRFLVPIIKTPLKLLKSLLIGFVFYHIVYTASSNAQTDSSVTPFCYHINAGATYSFVGYSTYATFGLNWDRHQFYIGIRNVLSKSYLYYTGPIGGKLGWNYVISENKKSKSFINVDHQNSYNRAYNPRSIFKDKLNSVHEVFISNGLDYKIANRIRIGEKMGIGMYREILNNLSLGVKQKNFGFNLFIDLHVQYEF